MIKNFIFDLYGTLADISTSEDNNEFYKRMALFYGKNGAYYERAEWKKEFLSCLEECSAAILNTTDSYKDEEEGVYTEPNIYMAFEMMFIIKGVKPDEALVNMAAEMYRTMSTRYIKLYPGVKNLITALKESNKKIYLLTNAQKIFTSSELKYLGIDELFDGIMISSEVGRRKPDLVLFNELISKYSLNPQECIMVGNDYECDILGARNAGMKTCYISSNLSPKEDKNKDISADLIIKMPEINKITKLFL